MTDGPYDIGDGLEATATFAVGATPTDPTTVTAEVREPDGTVTIYTYSAAPSQPDPHITRASAGVYELVLVPDAAGAWVVRWAGTGAVTAVVTQVYTVSANPITGATLGSYTADPANRLVDRVRLFLGDTTEPFSIGDAELEYFLSVAGEDALVAALAAAKALAFRFSRLVDATEGDVSRSYSQRYKQFAEAAKTLAADVDTAASAGVAPIVWAGGISVSEVAANAADGDLVPAYFYEGMDDRTGIVDRAWP